jgi:6,7-dimethyl-8-ribityllumazine synthase
VSLEQEIPVIFGVQTTDTLQQALARADVNGIHKGIESAETAVTMVKLIKELH